MTKGLFCGTPGTLKREKGSCRSHKKHTGIPWKVQLKINWSPNSHVKLTLRAVSYRISVLLVI